MQEYLRDFKPKDAPSHYHECLWCHGHDASYVLLEFGICLKCWGKFRKKIPMKIHNAIGRMFLYYRSKEDEICQECANEKSTLCKSCYCHMMFIRKGCEQGK